MLILDTLETFLLFWRLVFRSGTISGIPQQYKAIMMWHYSKTEYLDNFSQVIVLLFLLLHHSVIFGIVIFNTVIVA